MSTSETNESPTQTSESAHTIQPQAPLTEAERKKRAKARAKRRKELEKERTKAARADKKSASPTSAGDTDAVAAPKKPGLFGGLFGRSSSPDAPAKAGEAPQESAIDTTSGASPLMEAIPEPSLPADVAEELAAAVEALRSTAEAGPLDEPINANITVDGTEESDANVAEHPHQTTDTAVDSSDETFDVNTDADMPEFVATRHPNPITIAATATLQVMEAGEELHETEQESAPVQAVDLPSEPAPDLTWDSDVSGHTVRITAEAASTPETAAVSAELPAPRAEATASPAATSEPTDTPATVADTQVAAPEPNTPSEPVSTTSNTEPADRPVDTRSATPESARRKIRTAPQERLRPRARTRPAAPTYANEIREREREIRERIDTKRRELEALFNSTEQ